MVTSVVWEADVCADATELTNPSDRVIKIFKLIFFIMFPCGGLIGRWQMIFHQGTIVPWQPASELQTPREGNGYVSLSITRDTLYSHLLLWARTNPQFNNPFLYIYASHHSLFFLLLLHA